MPATTESRRGKEPPLPEPPAGAQPCRQLDFRLLTSRTEGEYISVALSHPVCGDLFQWLQETNTQGSENSRLRNPGELTDFYVTNNASDPSDRREPGRVADLPQVREKTDSTRLPTPTPTKKITVVPPQPGGLGVLKMADVML